MCADLSRSEVVAVIDQSKLNDDRRWASHCAEWRAKVAANLVHQPSVPAKGAKSETWEDVGDQLEKSEVERRGRLVQSGKAPDADGQTCHNAHCSMHIWRGRELQCTCHL